MACLDNIECLDCKEATDVRHICQRCGKPFYCEPKDIIITVYGISTTYKCCMKCVASALRDAIIFENHREDQ